MEKSVRWWPVIIGLPQPLKPLLPTSQAVLLACLGLLATVAAAASASSASVPFSLDYTSARGYLCSAPAP